MCVSVSVRADVDWECRRRRGDRATARRDRSSCRFEFECSPTPSRLPLDRNARSSTSSATALDALLLTLSSASLSHSLPAFLRPCLPAYLLRRITILFLQSSVHSLNPLCSLLSHVSISINSLLFSLHSQKPTINQSDSRTSMQRSAD